ncbi:hypothetical protein BAY01_01735 [Elizabethkingia miricola]|nr:hypothetical protein BAY01_01735 [Elizabethkingia miricola]
MEYKCSQNFTNNMESTGNQEFKTLIHSLKTSMQNYMEDANPTYSQNDIDECCNILTDYIENILKTNSKEEGMDIVEYSVKKLNDLNEKCQYELIETNEREQIAEIIIIGGNKMGYNSRNEDITEEWREW